MLIIFVCAPIGIFVIPTSLIRPTVALFCILSSTLFIGARLFGKVPNLPVAGALAPVGCLCSAYVYTDIVPPVYSY